MTMSVGAISSGFSNFAAMRMGRPQSGEGTESQSTVTSGVTGSTSETQSANNQPAHAGERELSQDERQEVKELERRDAEVRAHEQAHVAAGGQHAGGAQFSYQQGPDGQRYAVGGEVSISVSGGRTPEETIAKAQTVRRAALAPANPSAKDRQVAAKAASMESSAREEIAAERREELEETTEAAEGEIAQTKNDPEPKDASDSNANSGENVLYPLEKLTPERAARAYKSNLPPSAAPAEILSLAI